MDVKHKKVIEKHYSLKGYDSRKIEKIFHNINGYKVKDGFCVSVRIPKSFTDMFIFDDSGNLIRIM